MKNGNDLNSYFLCEDYILAIWEEGLQFCRWVFGSGYFQHNIDIVRYYTFYIARGIQFVFFSISSFPSFSLSTLYVGNTLDIRLGSLSWCLGHIFLFACRPAQLYTPSIINIHPYIFLIYQYPPLYISYIFQSISYITCIIYQVYHIIGYI